MSTALMCSFVINMCSFSFMGVIEEKRKMTKEKEKISFPKLPPFLM